MSCVDQIPEWIADLERFQEMPVRALADVARHVVEHGMGVRPARDGHVPGGALLGTTT